MKQKQIQLLQVKSMSKAGIDDTWHEMFRIRLKVGNKRAIILDELQNTTIETIVKQHYPASEYDYSKFLNWYITPKIKEDKESCMQ